MSDLRDILHLSDFVEALQDACKDAELDLTELEEIKVREQAFKYIMNQPLNL